MVVDAISVCVRSILQPSTESGYWLLYMANKISAWFGRHYWQHLTQPLVLIKYGWPARKLYDIQVNQGFRLIGQYGRGKKSFVVDWSHAVEARLLKPGTEIESKMDPWFVENQALVVSSNYELIVWVAVMLREGEKQLKEQRLAWYGSPGNSQPTSPSAECMYTFSPDLLQQQG